MEHLAGFYQSLPLVGAAKIAAGSGSQRTAAKLLGAFSHESAGNGAVGAYWQYERLVSQLIGDLGVDTFEDELGVGAQLSIAQALQLAEDIVSTTIEASR
jgi:hypothetical protein